MHVALAACTARPGVQHQLHCGTGGTGLSQQGGGNNASCGRQKFNPCHLPHDHLIIQLIPGPDGPQEGMLEWIAIVSRSGSHQLDALCWPVSRDPVVVPSVPLFPQVPLGSQNPGLIAAIYHISRKSSRRCIDVLVGRSRVPKEKRPFGPVHSPFRTVSQYCQLLVCEFNVVIRTGHALHQLLVKSVAAFPNQQSASIEADFSQVGEALYAMKAPPSSSLVNMQPRAGLLRRLLARLHHAYPVERGQQVVVTQQQLPHSADTCILPDCPSEALVSHFIVGYLKRTLTLVQQRPGRNEQSLRSTTACTHPTVNTNGPLVVAVPHFPCCGIRGIYRWI